MAAKLKGRRGRKPIGDRPMTRTAARLLPQRRQARSTGTQTADSTGPRRLPLAAKARNAEQADKYIARRDAQKNLATDGEVLASPRDESDRERKADELVEKLCKPSRGGRGKKNELKVAVLADVRERKLGVSKRTVERALAKAEGKKPQVQRYTAVPKQKPRSGKPVVGVEATRRHYLDCCAAPEVDFDTEREIILGTFKEIAGKRAVERTKAAKAAERLI